MQNTKIKTIKKLLIITSLFLNIKSVNKRSTSNCSLKTYVRNDSTVQITPPIKEFILPFSELNLDFIHKKRKISIFLQTKKDQNYTIKTTIKKRNIKKIIDNNDGLDIYFTDFNRKYMLSVNFFKNQLNLFQDKDHIKKNNLIQNNNLMKEFTEDFKIEIEPYSICDRFTDTLTKNLYMSTVVNIITNGILVTAVHNIIQYSGIMQDNKQQ